MEASIMAGVLDIDLGWSRILKELSKTKNSYVKVGVQEGDMHKPSDKGSKPKTTVSMATVAMANEFGAPSKGIPARSYLRSTYDESLSEIGVLVEAEYLKILEGKRTAEKSLDLLGEVLQKRVQSKITKLRDPPNKPATIKRKNDSSNPLIDTGQLRNSIRYVTFINGIEKGK